MLFFTAIACFFKQKNMSIFLLGCSVVSAYFHGTIDAYGLSLLVAFYAVTHLYFQSDIPFKTIMAILLTIILAMTFIFVLHLSPGFNNILVINKVRISKLSTPFSMNLNFDKIAAGIILFINSDLYKKEKGPDVKSAIVTLWLLFLCSATIMIAGLLSGYVRYNFKIPDILLLWSINNLFFVCLSEEVIFRGFIQKKIGEFSSSGYFTIVLASLIFGLAHYKWGIAHIILASVAGCFYGFVYQKTERIWCSMLVHFGLNLIHIIFFTYPAAIKTIS